MATGANSLASGYLTQANGVNSFVAGYGSKAGNNTSSAFGYQTIANGYYETVVGLLNDSLVASNSSLIPSSPLFIVGNGTNSANRKNALVVNNEGVTSLAMNPTNLSTDGVLQIKSFSSKDNIELYNSTGGSRWGMTIYPDLTFLYNGTVKCSLNAITGAYNMLSDSRLKKDISFLSDNTLSKINLLRPAAYHYLDNKKEDSYTMGFMAQDYYKIFPELTTYITSRNGEKFLGINYNNVSVLAIKAIQVQQKMIENLTTEKEELKNKLEDVTSRLERIEKILNK